MEHLLTTQGLFLSVVYTYGPILKLWNLFILDAKKFKDNIMLVEKISKFSDSFFRIKVYTPNFNHEKF